MPSKPKAPKTPKKPKSEVTPVSTVSNPHLPEPDNKDADNNRLTRLECYPEVEKMIKEGETSRRVAEYIHTQASEMLDVNFGTVVKMVRQRKDELERMGSKVTLIPDKVSVDSEDPLNELNKMKAMFDDHYERIKMEITTERTLRKLFSTTHKEIEVFEKLGTSIFEKKIQLGIIGVSSKRVPSNSEVTNGRFDLATVARNPESRHKILSAVEMLMGDTDIMDIVSEKGISKIRAELEVIPEESSENAG